MTKFRLNKAMFFVIIMAMLSMQWSAAHIHLAENHAHDGSNHKHQIKSHSHQSITTYDNYVDLSHQIAERTFTIVELDNDCNLRNDITLDDQPLLLTFINFQLDVVRHSSGIPFSTLNNSKQQYLNNTNINTF